MAQPDEITLQVSTPAGPFHGAFPKTTKVSEVIAAIVEAKGLDAGEDLRLMHGDQQLAPGLILKCFSTNRSIRTASGASGISPAAFRASAQMRSISSSV